MQIGNHWDVQFCNGTHWIPLFHILVKLVSQAARNFRSIRIVNKFEYNEALMSHQRFTFISKRSFKNPEEYPLERLKNKFKYHGKKTFE